MIVIEREVRASALKHDSRSVDQDTRTKVEIDALNDRSGISV